RPSGRAGHDRVARARLLTERRLEARRAFHALGAAVLPDEEVVDVGQAVGQAATLGVLRAEQTLDEAGLARHRLEARLEEDVRRAQKVLPFGALVDAEAIGVGAGGGAGDARAATRTACRQARRSFGRTRI